MYLFFLYQAAWILKSNIFGQKSKEGKLCSLQKSKETMVLYEYNDWQFVKKCQNLTFNVNFLYQESSNLSIFFSIQNNSLWAYSLKHFMNFLKSWILKTVFVISFNVIIIFHAKKTTDDPWNLSSWTNLLLSLRKI